MKKVIIFGTGGLASLLSINIKKDTEIVAFLDTSDNAPKEISGIPVIGMQDMKNVIFDYVVIGFSNVKKAIDELKKAGVEEKMIVGYSFIGSSPYDSNEFQKKIDAVLEEEVLNKEFEDLFLLPKKRFFACAMNQPEDYSVIDSDYVREQTLSLIAREIKRKNVDGNVAELGVFRGDFSKKINRLFPRKKLFLFDTFEGFNKIDIKRDTSLSWEKLDSFNETGVQIVLDKMYVSEMCVVKKGFFPESFDLPDSERFSFVSIDVDLYDPIKKGLEIFYPLLNKGGYIMVHDYNNIVYKGARDAVQDYCSQYEIPYVPIPDIAGTIVICK